MSGGYLPDYGGKPQEGPGPRGVLPETADLLREHNEAVGRVLSPGSFIAAPGAPIMTSGYQEPIRLVSVTNPTPERPLSDQGRALGYAVSLPPPPPERQEALKKYARFLQDALEGSLKADYLRELHSKPCLHPPPVEHPERVYVCEDCAAEACVRVMGFAVRSRWDEAKEKGE